MSKILPIYIWNNKALRQDCKDVSSLSTVVELITDLKTTMLNINIAGGLSAPQVGRSLKLFIVKGLTSDNIEVFINPKIIKYFGKDKAYKEGCLSIPDIYEDVIRPDRIKIEWYDEHFKKKSIKFKGLESRIIQHEFSHINGDLFIDHIPDHRLFVRSKEIENIKAGKIKVNYPVIFEDGKTN